MGSGQSGKNVQGYISPANLGLDAVELDADKESVWVDCRGRNQVTLTFELTRGGAETQIDLKMQHIDGDFDGDSSYSRKPLQTVDGAYVQEIATAIAGVLTIVDRVHRKGSITGNLKWVVNIPLNYKWVKFEVIRTAGTTDDTLKVHARLGYV